MIFVYSGFVIIYLKTLVRQLSEIGQKGKLFSDAKYPGPLLQRSPLNFFDASLSSSDSVVFYTEKKCAVRMIAKIMQDDFIYLLNVYGKVFSLKNLNGLQYYYEIAVFTTNEAEVL